MEHDTSVIVLRALGDNVRLSIVKALGRERHAISGCDIVNRCATLSKLAQPTISHHFHKLVEAGVLIEGKDGVAKHYRLDRQLLKTLGIDINKL